MSLLRTSGLTKTFGGVRAVDEVDLVVVEGQVNALIGPNGAGKTTLLNMLCGATHPTRGRIEIAGVDVTGQRPERIAAAGVARTFQNLELFAGMTVAEHALVGAHRHVRAGVVASALRLPRNGRSERVVAGYADDALELLDLAEHRDVVATDLPYGLQRRVELARALASRPRLLLLDEPMAGLSAGEAARNSARIRALVDDGLTVVLVEHHMETVMRLSDRVSVLNFGRLLSEGTPAEVQADPDVVEAYLGSEEMDRREPVRTQPTAGPAEHVRDRPPVTGGASEAVALLTARDLTAGYGRVQALKGVDLKVHEAEAVCLIGANGAGKTTLMRTLAGLHVPTAGGIELDGEAVTGWPAERMVKAGVSLVPEGRQVFGALAVIDNLMLGAFRSGADTRGTARDLQDVLDLFPVLADRRDQLAGTLSGGEQQMLAIGRALMARPRVLLLDEPSLGLAPLAVAEVVRRLLDLVARRVTILLVEQNAQAALRVASRGYVMASGEIVAAGPTEALLTDPAVRAAYLGAAVQEPTDPASGDAARRERT